MALHNCAWDSDLQFMSSCQFVHSKVLTLTGNITQDSNFLLSHNNIGLCVTREVSNYDDIKKMLQVC